MSCPWCRRDVNSRQWQSEGYKTEDTRSHLKIKIRDLYNIKMYRLKVQQKIVKATSGERLIYTSYCSKSDYFHHCCKKC